MKIIDFLLGYPTSWLLTLLYTCMLIGLISPQWGLDHYLVPMAFIAALVPICMLVAKFSF